MGWLASGLVAVLLFMAPILGYLEQPWAPWWTGQRSATSIQLGAPTVSVPSTSIDVQIPVGMVTDAQRYQLARAAGWSAADAVTATAISIAENGSGNPAALSAPNRDGSRDLGLWQVNSGWWSQFGGQAALENPADNAHAALVIFQRQGWCAWSTYEARCGPGHNGSYAAFLGRARAVAP